LSITQAQRTDIYKPPSPPPPQPQRGWAWLTVAAIVSCAMGATIFGFQQIQQQQIAQATATAHAHTTATAQAQATATKHAEEIATAWALMTATAQTTPVQTQAAPTETRWTFVTNLPTLPPITLTLRPWPSVTPTPTLFRPSPTAVPTKPLLAPGVYVTNIRPEPPNPKNVESIRFFVSFQNTAGPLKFQWCVYIFPAGQRGPIGQTSCNQWVDFPLGSYEYATLNTWHLGPGQPCTDLFVQVQGIETDGKRLIFKTAEGKENGMYFRVCP
jgi:hypothetical protein